MRDIKRPVALAWEEGGDVFGVEDYCVDTAVSIHVAKRQGRGRNPQAARHLVDCDVTKELLILLEHAITLIEINTRARVAPLGSEVQAAHGGDAVVEGHDVR